MSHLDCAEVQSSTYSSRLICVEMACAARQSHETMAKCFMVVMCKILVEYNSHPFKALHGVS